MIITIIFGVLALVCMVYYIIMVSYASIHTAFASVWLIMVIALAIIAAAAFFIHRKHIRIPVGVKITLCTLVGIGIAFFIFIEGLVISGMNSKPKEKLDYVIVLGAQVRGTRLTKSLRKRLETACDYLEQNDNTIAIVSGGQGSGEDISEAQCMYDYLIEQGIDSNRIYMENKSTNTDENIEYSMSIINDLSNNSAENIGIITNNFHIYRTVAVCRQKGYDVTGIPAGSDDVLLINYMFREFFAIVKYKAMGLI